MPEDREPSDEEVKERVRKLLGDHDLAHPESGADPAEAQLAEIEERSQAIRNRHRMPDPPDWNYTRPSKPIGKQTEIDYKGVGLGFSVLYALVGPLLVGFGIGWFIDSRTGGSGARVWGALIGAVAGLVGAVVTMMRLNPPPK